MRSVSMYVSSSVVPSTLINLAKDKLGGTPIYFYYVTRYVSCSNLTTKFCTSAVPGKVC